MPFSVAGKSAIVTGAGSGINLAFAALLLSKGCNVLFADIKLRVEAEKVLKEYSKKSKGRPRAVFLETDVTNWTQLSRMFDVATKEFGDIDLVCPGAGIFEPWVSNFWHPPGTPESRDKADSGRYLTLDVNLTHPIRVTQLSIAYFLNPPNGRKAGVNNPKRIVHISSVAGQRAALSIPIYGATKAGINSLIWSMAPLEARLGIRVNGVAPGIIETPLWREHPEKMHMLDEKIDLWASPQEVAEAMLLCAESDEYPGGTVLEVGYKNTRKVRALMDPGPSGQGHSSSNMKVAIDEVFQWLSQVGWGVPKL